ncbi:MAG: PQQ-binding-like beta-propeller repeat protein [Pirellulales bacterium]
MVRFDVAARAALIICSLAWLGSRASGESLLCGTAGDDLVAARMGLAREWVVQIPFDSAGWRLEHVTIGDELVVACSGDGGVHAVQAVSVAGGPRAGSVLWSRRLGRPGGPLHAAGVGPRIVTVARDLDVYAFDARTGAAVWHRHAGRPPSGGAVSVDDWTYAPLSADRLMRYAVNPLATPQAAAAPAKPPAKGEPAGRGAEEPQTRRDPSLPLSIDAGGRVESAPFPYDGGVAWITEGGMLVVIVPVSTGWKRLEFDLGAPVSGAAAVRDRSMVVATRRGDLARVADAGTDDVRNLDAVWHVLLDGLPEGGPLVSGETVVVSLGDEGLRAFAADTGSPMWTSAVAGRLVATTEGRAWCVDRVGRLVGVDLATGEPVAWMCLGSFTLPVVNTVSERMVLASPDGLVVSLAPRRTVSALPAAGKEPAEEDAEKPAEADKPNDT